jgi:Tfp pilus assembly protein PilW
MRQILRRRRLFGMTMPEVMIAAAVASMLSVGLVVAAITMQKNFKASMQYASSQAQQVRLLDYISRDLRRATTASVSNGVLTITIPDYYDATGQPRNPTLFMGRVFYNSPTAAVTVRYYQQNGQVIRQEGTTATSIADGVQDFQLSFVNQGQVVEASITFLPTFQQNGQGVRSGTAVYARTLLRNLLQS